MRKLLGSLVLIVGLLAVGCGGPERTITAAEEKAWRTPPKSPPPEYKGNMLGSPGSPPPGASSGPSGGK